MIKGNTMIILDENINLDENDTLSHKRFPFTLEKSFDRLIIKMAYYPRLVDEIDKKASLKEAVEKYLQDPIYTEQDREGTMDAKVENFLTTSLFYEGKFLGAYHNKNNDIRIFLSENESSLGYKKTPIKPGAYEFVLSMHACHSNVLANITLEAIDD